MRAPSSATRYTQARHDEVVRVVAAACATMVMVLASAHATAIDFSGIEARKVELFYPGQASWEWALTEKDHSGAPKFREGKNCRTCHDGEQKDMGKRIVSGEKLEPAPIANKPGSITLEVRSAHDSQRLYFQLRWKPSPATGEKLDPAIAAHVTVMLDDGGSRKQRAPAAGPVATTMRKAWPARARAASSPSTSAPRA